MNKSTFNVVGVAAAVAAVVVMSSGAFAQDTNFDGIWRRGDDSRYYQIKIDGNNWIYSEGPAGSVDEYSIGTWESSNSTITAPSTGTITLTITQIRPDPDEDLIDFPPEYNSVKTNTATYSLNASGDVFTISDAVLTTNGIWGTLEGTYQKKSTSISTVRVARVKQFGIAQNGASLRIVGTSQATPIRIYNLSGRLLMSRSAMPNEVISVSNLARGTYVVKALGNNVKIVR